MPAAFLARQMWSPFLPSPLLSLSWNDQDPIGQAVTCQVSSSWGQCAIPLVLFKSLYQTLSPRIGPEEDDHFQRRSYILSPPRGLHSSALLSEALSLLPKVKCVSNQNKLQIAQEFGNLETNAKSQGHSPPGLLLIAGPWGNRQRQCGLWNSPLESRLYQLWDLR